MDLSYILKQKDYWHRLYPELLSVYVHQGVSGDLLFIDDKRYILVNKFLAEEEGHEYD